MERGIRGVSKVLLLAPFFFFHYNIHSAEWVAGFAARHLVHKNGKILKAFFCPRDSKTIEKIIIDLIGQSKEVYGAFYQFTRTPVIDGLKAIHKARNVPVHVVVDANGYTSKVLSLPTVGIPLYMNNANALMHHKIMLFKGVLGARNVVMTGSMNMTDAGTQRNFENVLFTDDADVAAQYEAEVRALMDSSYCVTEVESPYRNKESTSRIKKPQKKMWFDEE